MRTGPLLVALTLSAGGAAGSLCQFSLGHSADLFTSYQAGQLAELGSGSLVWETGKM